MSYALNKAFLIKHHVVTVWLLLKVRQRSPMLTGHNAAAGAGESMEELNLFRNFLEELLLLPEGLLL